MIKYHRYWPFVCRLEDEQLKDLITWTQDEDAIAGLNEGFREIFSNHEIRPWIPASAMRSQAIRNFLSNGKAYEEITLSELYFAEWFQWSLGHHRFPEIYKFSDEGREYATPVPDEVLRQLDGVEFRAGQPVYVSYMGKDCLVGYVLDTGWAELKNGWRFETGKGKTYFGIELVPVEYINLNA